MSQDITLADLNLDPTPEAAPVKDAPVPQPEPPVPMTRQQLIEDERNMFEKSVYQTCMAIVQIAAFEDRRVVRGIVGQKEDGSFEVEKPHPIFAGPAVTVTTSIEVFLTQKLKSFNGWEMISIGKPIALKGDTQVHEPDVLYVKAHKSTQCTLVGGAYYAADSMLVGKVRFADGDTRPAVIGRNYPLTFGGNPMVEDLTKSLMFANNFGIFRVVNFNQPGMRVLDTLGFRNIDTFWTNHADTESQIYHRIRDPKDQTKYLWSLCDEDRIARIKEDIETKIIPHRLEQLDANAKGLYEARMKKWISSQEPEKAKVDIEVIPETTQTVDAPAETAAPAEGTTNV